MFLACSQTDGCLFVSVTVIQRVAAVAEWLGRGLGLHVVWVFMWSELHMAALMI